MRIYDPLGSEDHDVVPRASKTRERLLAVRGEFDIEACCTQPSDELPTDAWIVFDDKDTLGIHGCQS